MTDPRNTRQWKAVAKAIIERDSVCSVCGTDQGLSVDHIIPLSLGGSPFDPDNLVTMCMTHNRQKSNKVTGQLHDWINKDWLAYERRAA